MADIAGVENNSPPFGPDEGRQKQQKNNGDIVVINRQHLHHPHRRNNINNDNCCSPSSSSCSSSSSYFSSCTSTPRAVVMNRNSKGEEGHGRPHGDEGQEEVYDEEHTIGSTPPGVVTASSSKSSISMIDDDDDDDEESKEEDNKRDNENSYVNPISATTTKTTTVTPNNNNTTAHPWGPIICKPTPTTISHTENEEELKGAGEGSIYKKDDGIGSCVVNVLVDTAGADNTTTTTSSHPVGIETSREVKNASVNNQEEDDGISCVSAATTATTSITQVCRICLEGEGGPSLRLVSPCNCTGSVGRMHVSCLEKWLGTTGLSTCELCGYQFELVRQPRPVSDLFKNKFFVSNVVYFLVMSLVAGVSIWLCLVDTGLYLEHGHYWVVVEWVCIAFVILLFYSVWCKSAFRGQYQIWLEWKGKGQAVKIKGISENNEEEADLADEDDDETDSQSQRCATKCV